MKVRNLIGNSGRAIPNQFVIEDDNKKVFQSYKSVIVEVECNSDFCELNIGRDWDYSRTTTKYFKIFLINEVGFTDEEVETMKKQLRKGHDFFGVGRFVVRYYDDLR